MQFFLILLLVCFFIFLFALYRLSQDDFILIRKGINMEEVFNAVIAIAFISLICARLVYIFSFPKPIFFTFLGSVLFPYFPGLSLVGCVFGGVISLVLYVWSKKFPLGRILDFFTLSFLYTLPLGFLFIYLVSDRASYLLISLVFYLVFLLLNIFILFPLLVNGKIKDGGIGLVFLVVFSLFTIIVNVISAGFNFVYFLENILLFSGLILSSAFFIYRQFIEQKKY